MKPGQVGVCIEAFIAAKTFKVVGLGNNRTFSGDDPKLTSKFSTQMVITPSADGREAYVFQRTQAGVSKTIDPTLPALPGTAVTTLNGAKSGPDGTSQTTAPVDRDGVTRINASTSAENGFSARTGIDFGTIRTSINLEVNAKSATGDQVKVDAGSLASEYPSMAIYSYANVNGKIVTTRVWKQDEGSPDALKQPMKPIPDQTQPQ